MLLQFLAYLLCGALLVNALPALAKGVNRDPTITLFRLDTNWLISLFYGALCFVIGAYFFFWLDSLTEVSLVAQLTGFLFGVFATSFILNRIG